jgi:hypothetical protein
MDLVFGHPSQLTQLTLLAPVRQLTQDNVTSKETDYFGTKITNQFRIKDLVDNIISLPSKIKLLEQFKIEHKIVHLTVLKQYFKCKRFNHMVEACFIPKKGNFKKLKFCYRDP